MGYFEQYPWLAIVAIVVTVEGWAALKSAVAHALAHYRRTRAE